MSRKKLVVLKEADLTNNCPECFNQELRLTFYQKHRLGRFMHRATNEITHEMGCKKCHTAIYPVNWTEDIERVYGYYEKTLVPEKSVLKFTKLFYAVILFLIALIAIGIYLFAADIIPMQRTSFGQVP